MMKQHSRGRLASADTTTRGGCEDSITRSVHGSAVGIQITWHNPGNRSMNDARCNLHGLTDIDVQIGIYLSISDISRVNTPHKTLAKSFSNPT